MDFTDLPMGFGVALAENQVALNVYSSMPEEQKQAVIDRARGARTVEEMHSIVSSIASGSFT